MTANKINMKIRNKNSRVLNDSCTKENSYMFPKKSENYVTNGINI